MSDILSNVDGRICKFISGKTVSIMQPQTAAGR